MLTGENVVGSMAMDGIVCFDKNGFGDDEMAWVQWMELMVMNGCVCLKKKWDQNPPWDFGILPMGFLSPGNVCFEAPKTFQFFFFSKFWISFVLFCLFFFSKF